MGHIRELTLGAVIIIMIIIAGCSTLQPDTPSYNNDKDPIVGLWFSKSPDSVTYFIFGYSCILTTNLVTKIRGENG